MIPFTVCLIARNEAKTLPRLVDSLREFKLRGGKIIVLDTGSTDGTPDIASNIGCTVHEVGDRFRRVITGKEDVMINQKFIAGKESPVVKEGDSLFDFAAARNYVASLAHTDMICMPDCDEVYTRFDIDRVCREIENGAEQLEYQFVFSHDEYGSEVIKFRHCKFYDRRKLKWVGIVHEVLQGDANRVYLDESVIKLEHFQNHETNRGGYLTGLALDCYENPDNDRNSHYLARELMWSGRTLSALKEFTRHIEMDKWPSEAAQSLIFSGDCYRKLDLEKIAINMYFEAYHKEPNRREALIRIADYYREKDMPQPAAAFAEAALTIPEHDFYANNAAHYREYPHEILYWAYWYIGDREKSKIHFHKALEYCPKNPKYLNDAQFYQ